MTGDNSHSRGGGHAVAIVGMGCRLPGAADLSGFSSAIESGVVPVREVPGERWDHRSFYDPNPRQPDRTYARLLASVDDIDEFSPEHFGILPRRGRMMDPQQRLILDAARMAIEDAGRAPAAAAAEDRRVRRHLGVRALPADHRAPAGDPAARRSLRPGAARYRRGVGRT